MKNTMLWIGVVILLLALIIGVTFFSLGMDKYFSPKFQDVRREVFEGTKSYSHGKIQELAKYYEEYYKTDSEEDKESISSLVKMNLSDFDESKISNYKLKSFLILTRGY